MRSFHVTVDRYPSALQPPATRYRVTIILTWALGNDADEHRFASGEFEEAHTAAEYAEKVRDFLRVWLES